MSLIDDFKAQFSEFPPATVDQYWAMIEATWPCMYGGVYGSNTCDDQAILWLIAHLLLIDSSGSNSPSKGTSSKSVGNVSVSYIVGDTDGNTIFFGSTRYGQRFMMLTAKNAPGAIFV